MKNSFFSKSHFCILFLVFLTTFCFLPSTKTTAQTTSSENKDSPAKSRLISAITIDKTGYFPKEFWYRNDFGEKLQVFPLYYSKYLKAAKEKSLIVPINNDIEVYRFFKLAWRSKDFVIRLEKKVDKIELFSTEFAKEDLQKILAPDGFLDPNYLKTKETEVSLENFNQFISLLEKANYWQMLMNDFENMGNDGSEWILESVKDGRYHIADRWSPDGTNFSEACLYLRKLSSIEDN